MRCYRYPLVNSGKNVHQNQMLFQSKSILSDERLFLYRKPYISESMQTAQHKKTQHCAYVILNYANQLSKWIYYSSLVLFTPTNQVREYEHNTKMKSLCNDDDMTMMMKRGYSEKKWRGSRGHSSISLARVNRIRMQCFNSTINLTNV